MSLGVGTARIRTNPTLDAVAYSFRSYPPFVKTPARVEQTSACGRPGGRLNVRVKGGRKEDGGCRVIDWGWVGLVSWLVG